MGSSLQPSIESAPGRAANMALAPGRSFSALGTCICLFWDPETGAPCTRAVLPGLACCTVTPLSPRPQGMSAVFPDLLLRRSVRESSDIPVSPSGALLRARCMEPLHVPTPLGSVQTRRSVGTGRGRAASLAVPSISPVWILWLYALPPSNCATCSRFLFWGFIYPNK